MSETTGRLAEIIADFSDADPHERLEMLRDYSDAAPPLPERWRAERDAGVGRVPECMTPVFLYIDVVDGRVHMVADVAPEAPTVRGVVALLVDAFHGAPVDEVLAMPANLVQQLGLHEVLGMQRANGLHGILRRVLNEVRKKGAVG
ncbi:MAG: SufE family protein [Planctomycetes bacterium]|nr:SufE family protein [Planctomycetota bacterium]